MRRCCERVSRPQTVRFFPCEGKVTVVVGGKAYCAVHNPANVAKRRARTQEKRDVETLRRNYHNSVAVWNAKCARFVEAIERDDYSLPEVLLECARLLKGRPKL